MNDKKKIENQYFTSYEQVAKEFASKVIPSNPVENKEKKKTKKEKKNG